MKFKFPFAVSNEFVAVDSYVRAFALAGLFALTFALTFAVVPFQQWKMHFYQAGIFSAGFVFGPFAGAAVGALSSSYNALYVLNNPWIIGGNALLGFFAAYFYSRMGAVKGAMAAFAIQAPYVYVTDVYLMHMPIGVVLGILATLFATNLACAYIASFIAPLVSRRI